MNGESDGAYDPNDTVNSSIMSSDVTLPNGDEVMSPQKDVIANGDISVTLDGQSNINANAEQCELEQITLGPTVAYADGELAPADTMWTTKANGAVKVRAHEQSKHIPYETVHSALLRCVKKYPNNTALAVKRNGVWVKWSYVEYYRDTRNTAKSLLKLGLKRYHGVGIIGFNSPEWFITNFGAMFAGGFGTGIYTTNSADACQYVASNCQANVIVVENHAQLTKILKVWDKLPDLKAIVQYTGKVEQARQNVYSWDDFMVLGRDVPDSTLDDIIKSQAPNQCCSLIYTSGTTGNPKGVMITHDGILYQAKSCVASTKLGEGTDSVVSYLPLSHIAAQLFDIYIPLVCCGAVYFAQPDALKGTLVNTLKEVRPTAFIGVPRVWEKIQEKMRSIGAGTTGLKKMLAEWAKDIGLRGNLAMDKGESVPWGWTLANFIVFRKVRQALGLDRCFLTFSAGAPIAADTVNYFLSINIRIYNIYGMSESSGPHTISIPDCYKIGSAGQCLPGAETKIRDPDQDGIGEICYNGRHVFMGYLNMQQKMEEAIDEQGWLRSGDLGYVDAKGFLYITGRIKELIITAGGENIPPVPIEDVILVEAPLLSNCMVIGDQRKFLSLLVTLKVNVDEETQVPTQDLNSEALTICKKLGSNTKTVSAAQHDDLIAKHIQHGVDAYNKQAPSRAQMIQKWKMLNSDFSVAGGELGPTLKLKRPIVVKQYAKLIDSIYAE